jgi:hypothetical protein
MSSSKRWEYKEKSFSNDTPHDLHQPQTTRTIDESPYMASGPLANYKYMQQGIGYLLFDDGFQSNH